MQLDAPVSGEYVPEVQASTMLVPLHAEPAGHSAQLVCVIIVPPDVNEPAGQIEYSPAWFPLHLSSAPQSSQLSASSVDHVPAKHGTHDTAPLAA